MSKRMKKSEKEILDEWVIGEVARREKNGSFPTPYELTWDIAGLYFPQPRSAAAKRLQYGPNWPWFQGGRPVHDYRLLFEETGETEDWNWKEGVRSYMRSSLSRLRQRGLVGVLEEDGGYFIEEEDEEIQIPQERDSVFRAWEKAAEALGRR